MVDDWGRYDRCPQCGCYDWRNRHKCPPVWAVVCKEYGVEEDDPHTVYATDAEEAAEKWADDHDPHWEYHIVAGAEVLVQVRLLYKTDDPWVTYAVTGETVPQYSAVEVESEPKVTK